VGGLRGGEGRGSFFKSCIACGRWFASTLLVCDNISKAKTGAQRAGVFFFLADDEILGFWDDREPPARFCVRTPDSNVRAAARARGVPVLCHAIDDTVHTQTHTSSSILI